MCNGSEEFHSSKTAVLINNYLGWLGFFDLCSFATANPQAEVWETKPSLA